MQMGFHFSNEHLVVMAQVW